MTANFEYKAFDLLANLVTMRSVNPVYGGKGEVEIASFVEQRLRSKGIDCFRQSVLPGRENVIARIGPENAPAILLDAHMDTVGVEGWLEGNPFELVQKGNRFYGRGSCDTKASLACFLLVLEHFAENPNSLNRALVFAATVDEESEQLGAYELSKLKKELRIDSAVTGEPTCSDVISRHKGVGRYLVTIDGKAAHASTPELGENAIYKAARLCGRLEEHAKEIGSLEVSSEIERGTLNVGMINGGVGFNIVPDACQLDIDRRLGRNESARAARARLQAICQAEPGAQLEVFLERPPLVGADSARLVEALIGSARKVGAPIAEREVPYMTNAVAYEEAGIPAVVFGPGDIAQAHKVDEFIEKGEMLRSFDILRELLGRSA